MEVNPRLWQWHGLAAACGVDFPRIAYGTWSAKSRSRSRMNGQRRRWAITLLPGERAGAAAPAVRGRGLRARRPQACARPGGAAAAVNAIAADLRLRLAPRALPLGWLAAPALLGIGWLLPAEGFGLGVRLAGATACLLLPGALIARAFRLSGLAPAFVGSLAALFAAMAIMFAVHGSLWLAFALSCSARASARSRSRCGRRRPRVPLSSLGVGALGLVAGISLWWVAAFGGDAFFHIGRIRKLVDLGSISLRSLDEFRDGGLHPGYAFPLWHGFMALMTKLAGVDPAAAVLHAPTVLLPLSFVLVFEAGTILFRSRWGGLATVLLQFALLGLAPGPRRLADLARAGGERERMLLFPALLAVVFAYVREPSWAGLAAVAAAAGAIALTHPPHSALVVIVLAGFLVARALLARQDVGPLAAALAAVDRPSRRGRALAAADRAGDRRAQPVRRRASPRLRELPQRARRLRAAPLPAEAGALRPGGRRRGGRDRPPAARRLRTAAALGGVRARRDAGRVSPSLCCLRLPALRRRGLDLAGAEDRRLLAAGGSALVGGALVLARLLGAGRSAGRLAAGIALQHCVSRRLRAALPAGRRAPRRADLDRVLRRRRGRCSLAAFFGRRMPQVEGGPVARGRRRRALRPAGRGSRLLALVAARRGAARAAAEARRRACGSTCRAGDVVFSDPLTAYELGAFAPVYINAAPHVHVASTRANRPDRARARRQRFFQARRPALAAPRYGAALAARRPARGCCTSASRCRASTRLAVRSLPP